MMKRLMACPLLLILAVGLVSGCSSGARAATPEAAVQNADFGSLQQAQIVGVRYLDAHAVVPYTGVDRTSGNGEVYFMLGYAFAAPTSTGWRAENYGAMGASATPDPGATPAALLMGTLIVEDGCLRVREDGGDTSYLVIWQPDYYLTDNDGTLEILDRGGFVVARVGEPIRLGGGVTSAGAAEFNPQLQRPIPASCGGPYWFMGQIEPQR